MDQRMASLEAMVARLAASMEEVNRRMAAQQRVPEEEAGAAEQGRPEISPPQGQAFSPLIDTRMLTKPKTFSGRDEDWASWAVVTRAYCGALDPRFLAEMTEVEDTDEAVTNDKLGEAAKQRSATLYYVLAMLMDGRAQSMLSNCTPGHGYEMWRRLVREYEPKVGMRSRGLLVQILNYDFDTADVLASLERWEALIRHYDASCSSEEERLQPSVKIATVVAKVGRGQLQDHLMMHASAIKSYDELRSLIVGIVRAQKQLVGQTTQQAQGAVPMEIGGFQQKKKELVCFACGKKGHVKADCWSQKGDSNGKGSKANPAAGKGKGKGQSKSKGGAKAKAKGKMTDVVCHRCGKTGHMRAECRSKWHTDGRALNAVDDGEGADARPEISGLMLCAVERPPGIGPEESDEVLCAVEQPPGIESDRVVRIGVDSGAGVSVWPKELCDDYPTKQTHASMAGVSYSSAASGTSRILNEGERIVQLNVCGSKRGARMQVARVRKPLLSVAEMNDAGHDVYFLSGQDGAYSRHRKTGLVTKFFRRNGVFEIDARVPLFSGFSRQPSA